MPVRPRRAKTRRAVGSASDSRQPGRHPPNRHAHPRRGQDPESSVRDVSGHRELIPETSQALPQHGDRAMRWWPPAPPWPWHGHLSRSHRNFTVAPFSQQVVTRRVVLGAVDCSQLSSHQRRRGFVPAVSPVFPTTMTQCDSVDDAWLSTERSTGSHRFSESPHSPTSPSVTSSFVRHDFTLLQIVVTCS